MTRPATQKEQQAFDSLMVGKSLNVIFADDLPSEYIAPDEIVEGLLTAGEGSVLYGDSNSGKTFVAIDLACAVARGIEWQGRRTEQGLVVYLAAENPASVRGRLQAYQRHHGVTVPNFAIVQNPINLFDNDDDADKIIELVRALERKTQQKVRLIIGDTLARLSAGANENAGQDMGLVVNRFDRIRAETGAHFLLIHHCGKNAASGARGWSGVKAAVDTEIEITDTPSGRCAEITKQRDLGTKGDRIGFRLQTVTLGLTKWGSPATSCIVMPDEATEAFQEKRPVLGKNQKIARDALGESLRKSQHIGKDGAPATRPCIDYAEAVKLVAERMPTDAKHRNESAKRALGSLVANGYLGMKGDWLWDC